MDLARLQLLHQGPGIAQSADHGAAHGDARHLVGSLPQAGAGAHLGKGIGGRVLPGEEIGGRAQGGLHHAAGGPEDHARTGGHAHGAVQGLLGQVGGVQLVGPEHPHKLPGGQHPVHVRAVLGGHGGQLALRLFGHAGHDGHAADLLRLHPKLLGKPALGHAAEHLLGGLGAGQLAHQLGVLTL